MGCSRSPGNVCASSKSITLWAILCSLRQEAGCEAYIDSSNCTFVVTMIGKSQFSVANFFISVVSSSLSALFSFKLEWCSNTFSSPKIRFRMDAVWEMILVNGIDKIIRFFPV